MSIKDIFEFIVNFNLLILAYIFFIIFACVYLGTRIYVFIEAFINGYKNNKKDK